jgi:hypothetical protein
MASPHDELLKQKTKARTVFQNLYAEITIDRSTGEFPTGSFFLADNKPPASGQNKGYCFLPCRVIIP